MRTWLIEIPKLSYCSDEDKCSWQKHTATLHPITAALHNKNLYLTESLKTCWPVNHEKVFCVIPRGGEVGWGGGGTVKIQSIIQEKIRQWLTKDLLDQKCCSFKFKFLNQYSVWIFCLIFACAYLTQTIHTSNHCHDTETRRAGYFNHTVSNWGYMAAKRIYLLIILSRS